MTGKAVPLGSKRACSHGCGLVRYAGPMKLHESKCLAPWTLERLLEVYAEFVRGPDDCWSGCAGGRSGRLASGKVVNLYVAAASIVHGHVPEPFGKDAKIVCHHCDNRDCWNPRHLYVGTPASNVRDMVERGREVFDPPPVVRGAEWLERHAADLARRRTTVACFACASEMIVSRHYARVTLQPACSDECKKKRRRGPLPAVQRQS